MISGLNDAISYAEDHGHPVYWGMFKCVPAQAVKLPSGRSVIGVDLLQTESSADAFCKTIHELGHCEEDAFYDPLSTCSVRGKCENKADRWAVLNSVSADAFDQAVADGYTEIWQLADHFGVTEDFMRKIACFYLFGNLSDQDYLPS